MTDRDPTTHVFLDLRKEIDIGNPVEWMVDVDDPKVILGVTYEFSGTGERKTVWYTPNKRRAKRYALVDEVEVP